MIVATHSNFPGVDPWNELASIHQIQASGFNLQGNYYHAYTPVLQILLLTVIPVFGAYNAITYFGQIFGWILAFIFLYKLSREFFSAEKAVFVLLLYACANIGYQYLTTPESIALGIGFATVFFFIRSLKNSSRKYIVATMGTFILLIFTHNLTSLCVILVIGAIVALRIFTKRKGGVVVPTGLFIWLSMLAVFLGYYELYLGQLSSLLTISLVHPMIGIPTGWPKPLLWWVIYILPEAILVSLLAAWIVPFLMSKKIPKT